MNYIVFDLEWNQSPDGKKHEDARLPFEIIEIGAVKLNDDKEITDSFQRLVRPQVYRWIHDSIHEVVHVDYKDLRKGTPFPQAVREFLEWCGPQYYLFTWGSQDVMELQRNMKYYGILEMLPGPVKYYNVQKLFSMCFEEGPEQRSLEYAADRLSIPKRMGFHRALSDAWYTACILQKLDAAAIQPYFSMDVYQNPKTKKEEVHISYPTHTIYVSREFPTREKAAKDREVASTRCPLCGNPAKRRVRWFMNNSKVYYSVSCCQKHGALEGRIRIRRTEDGNYYAIKRLRLIRQEEAEEIRMKRDAMRMRRHIKRESCPDGQDEE